MTHDESSNPLVPADDAVESSTSDDETLSDIASEQDEQAQKFAAEFLKKVIRLRGVQIDRDDYLRQELRKLGADDETIALAQETTPVQAGLTPAQLDGLATATIAFETRKSAAISFAAGLPGGFAMLATIPADVTQYYVHAFRVMQKLAYIYGWKDFLGDLDEVEDETLGKMSLFLGVMMGVGGAASSLTTFAKQVARPALQKQIAQQALTKTAWYGPMKQTLKLIGIKISKDSFAKGVTRTVPVIGGVISGGMTLVALRTQSTRLQKHLRELPPPGVDAAQYLAALDDLDAQVDEPGALAERPTGGPPPITFPLAPRPSALPCRLPPPTPIPTATCPPSLDPCQVTSPDASGGHARESPCPACCGAPDPRQIKRRGGQQ